LQRELECIAQLDGYLLLLEKNKFVVLHVVFRICLQVGSKFMEVKTIFIAATLAIQKELAKLAGAERGAYHSIIQNKLVHWQNGDGWLAGTIKGEVGGVRWTTPGGVVDVVCIYHHFQKLTILPEILNGFQFFFVGDFWGEAYYIDQGFLNYA